MPAHIGLRGQGRRKRTLLSGLATVGVIAAALIPGPGSAAAAVLVNGGLNDVSCVTAKFCMAVGVREDSNGDGHFFSVKWNGTSWRRVAMPTPDGLTQADIGGVACPTTSLCFAVGSAGTTDFNVPWQNVLERWSHGVWTLRPMPTPSGATAFDTSAISCVSATACTAVGHYLDVQYQPLAESWNGTSWHVQSLPPAAGGNGDLVGVSCWAAAGCTAVGSENGGVLLVLRKAHGAWTKQTAPKPTGSSNLHALGVSCVSATSCRMAGSYYVTTTATFVKPLVERWNGTNWRIQPTPSGPFMTYLKAIDCFSVTLCTAVGANDDHAVDDPTSFVYTGEPEAMRWNGTAWKAQKTVSHSNRWDHFEGVSCPTSTQCFGVGATEYQPPAQPHTMHPLIERWVGAAWKQQNIAG